jgi:hypothetical protein
MTGVRWAAAPLVLALAAAVAPAPGLIISSGPYYGYPLGGASVSFGHGHIHGHLGFALGGPYGFGYGPYGYGYSSTRVTVVYSPPPQVVLVSPPPDDLTLDLLRERLLDDALFDRLPPDRPPQGEQHFGGFHKVEPPNGRRPAPEPLKPPVPPPEAPKPPAPPPMPPAPPAPMPPAPPLKEPPELPKPPAPLDDPKAEYDRLLALGRAAFADQQYGRAAERFRQAAVLQPNQPMPQFLLAETLFAQGKYHDAVDAIHAGMLLQPDWPTARFQPLELYGPHPADYADQLKALQDALDRRPGDPDLLFLTAYALWFDGRKDDARALFQKALPGAADPAMVQRFLRAAAGGAAL